MSWPASRSIARCLMAAFDAAWAGAVVLCAVVHLALPLARWPTVTSGV
jgi:hypothetical protein